MGNNKRQDKIRIIMAQINPLVGDIKGNAKQIIQICAQALNEHQADLVVFPELALCGYPPEDLILRTDFHTQVKAAIAHIAKSVSGVDLIFGAPERVKDMVFNTSIFIKDQQVIANYHKQLLPNYGVFDEKRYFKPGKKTCVIDYKGIKLGLLICEDLWHTEPLANAVADGAQAIICINASPFDSHKLRVREQMLHSRIIENKVPIIYVHCFGGQDEVVFDGRSMVMNQDGEITHLAPPFEAAFIPVDICYKTKASTSNQAKTIDVKHGQIIERISTEARIYRALVTGVRDYIRKNKFPGALIGLSGGIDSALTACIAADAIGPENVHAIAMPSRYTAEISLIDARLLAENLGIKYTEISIEPAYQAFLESLQASFANTKVDVTEENIQARCRGLILMAFSNKFRYLVLTTGNKSEMATGYATLYGDMAGGFAVLKDVYKTLVYQLSNYRNQVDFVIPQRIIERPPSAELAFEQKDQDTLPDYDTLDEILKSYIEDDLSVSDIVANGFDRDTVERMIAMVNRNEYKRRQAPPGVKITTRAFGRDRRYPITCGFKSE